MYWLSLRLDDCRTEVQFLAGTYEGDFYFNVLLTVHLNIFISVINQLDVQNFCFTISFISCLYMFRALCAHHQEVKIVLYSIWYHHTCRWPPGAQVRVQFWPPDDEHMVLETCRAWNKLTVKQKFCASSWLITEINTRESQMKTLKVR